MTKWPKYANNHTNEKKAPTHNEHTDRINDKRVDGNFYTSFFLLPFTWLLMSYAIHFILLQSQD